MRRWADAGRVRAIVGPAGRRYIDGVDLAKFATELAAGPHQDKRRGQSARNRFTGIVTHVTKDGVAAQVEIQSGPHRFVSLITREAADELELEPGMRADAVVKAPSAPGRHSGFGTWATLCGHGFGTLRCRETSETARQDIVERMSWPPRWRVRQADRRCRSGLRRLHVHVSCTCTYVASIGLWANKSVHREICRRRAPSLATLAKGRCADRRRRGADLASLGHGSDVDGQAQHR